MTARLLLASGAFALLSSAAFATDSACQERVLNIPNAPYNGPFAAEMSAPPLCSLDSQKTLPYPNITGYDWWYFDAVDVNLRESVTIVFMEQGAEGFTGGPTDELLSILAQFTFANGTSTSVDVPATGAVIREGPGGVQGVWNGTGFTFRGSPLGELGTTYAIEVDSPELGVKGSFIMTATAPPHYPCSSDCAGATEVVVPHIGWANAVPDAVAIVDFVVNGTRIAFTGAGYHDKNWGDGVPFASVVQSWYWGHARLGPYSVVWFDTLTTDGTEHFSGYVSKDGCIIEASCGLDAVVARPYGNNSEYPPTPTTGTPSGLGIKFDLGQKGILQVNVTSQTVVLSNGFYERITGPAFGGLLGGPQFQGVALHETFKL